MALSERQITLALVGGVAVLALVYIASETSQTQADGAEDSTVGGTSVGFNFGGSVDLTDVNIARDFHEWVPGFDPVDSGVHCVKPRVRYPRVSGGNASTVIHHGFDGFRFPGVDGEWADAPPSEVSL